MDGLKDVIQCVVFFVVLTLIATTFGLGFVLGALFT